MLQQQTGAVSGRSWHIGSKAARVDKITSMKGKILAQYDPFHLNGYDSL